MPARSHFRINDEVAGALEARRPVVALESTLITHGLPRPLNLETAQTMEAEVRSAGAVPATIAVLNGEIRVGLSEQELTQLATNEEALKVSSRGLSYVVATGQDAGTTVSCTKWAAQRVGIRYFATGGIGGVHHGASESGDVSTDLTELARTPVAVVCSGAKSILDIARTLENLETLGVPVFGYETDEFPAFFSRSSGHPVPYRLDGASEAAQVCRTHWELGQPSGLVIASPPPMPVEDQDSMLKAIEQANQEAREQSVVGGDVTPFVLQRIAELTDGASLRVNTALLIHNAFVAAEIAVADTRHPKTDND
jgi:pseudouridylate synthase